MLDQLDQLSPDPTRALTFKLVVTVSRALSGSIVAVAVRFGRLDGIVFNAGVNGPHSVIDDYPEDAFDRASR